MDRCCDTCKFYEVDLHSEPCNRCRGFIGRDEHKYWQPKEDNQTAKSDKGKLKLTLVPQQIIKDIAKIREYGNQKYSDPENWKTVEISRYLDAFLRHSSEMVDKGIDSKDEESGLLHAAHAACNLAFILQMIERD